MRSLMRFPLFLALIVSLSSYVLAQETTIEPKADELLRAMSEHLGGLQSFSFSTDEEHDINFWSGEQEKVSKEQEVVVQRPNKLSWTVTKNKDHAFGVYDGQTISFAVKEKKIYTQVVAPDNLDAALDFVAAGLKLPMPVADILYASPYDSYVIPGTQGEYLGEERVKRTKCHHLSFKHPALEWEMWIQKGDKPLLRKLSLFYTKVEGVPSSTIYLNDWVESPEIKGDTFSFTAPEGFQKVKIKVHPPKGATPATPDTPATSADTQQ